MHEGTTAALAERFERDTGTSLARQHYQWTHILDGLDVRNRRVLDVGCGTGANSVYLAAFAGASEVVGIDPSMGEGSSPDVHQTSKRLASRMETQNVTFLRDDFRTAVIPGRFDLVVAINVLHHIHKTERDARRDTDARNDMQPTLRKMYDALNPGGWLLIAESSRHNVMQITRYVGIRGYMCLKTIEWSTKQMPDAWLSLSREAGFQNLGFAYLVPYRLRRMGPLLKNQLGSYLTTSAYVIRGQRLASENGN